MLKTFGNVVFLLVFTKTIRLRARDFYEVIVDEGEARINYHLIEIEKYLLYRNREIFAIYLP